MADDNDGAALEAATDEDLWDAATSDQPAPEAGEEGNDAGAQDEGDTGDGEAEDDGGSDADPWADADPALKAHLDQLKRERDDFQQRYNSTNGRLAPASRKIAEQQAEIERLKAAAPQPPGGTKEERLAALREDFPELAEALGAITADYDSELQGLKARQAESVQAVQDRVQAEVETQHPGFMGFLHTHWEEFGSWIEDQPKRLRDAAARNMTGFVNASEVSEIVSGFKQHLNPGPAPSNGGKPNTPDPKRERALSALSSPPNRGRGVSQAPAPRGDDEAALWDHAVAQSAGLR